MKISVIVVLIILWVALIWLLVRLIKKWYIAKGASDPKNVKNSPVDDLKDMIGKSGAIFELSTVSRKAFMEKIRKADANALVGIVKIWLKETDHDKLHR